MCRLPVGAALLAAALAVCGAVRALPDPDGQMFGDPGAAAPYWRFQT